MTKKMEKIEDRVSYHQKQLAQLKAKKKEEVTDAELAIATKTTKAYKEDKNLQAEVAKVLANAVIPTPEPVKEPERMNTYRSGEPRR